MDFFDEIPSLDAANYIINKYSAKDKNKDINTAARSNNAAVLRDVAPVPTPPLPPYPAPIYSPPTVRISVSAEHLLRETIRLMADNLAIYKAFFHRTNNRRAKQILNNCIITARFNLDLMRNIYFRAFGFYPEFCPPCVDPCCRVITNMIFKELFTNEAQILNNLNRLLNDVTMLPFREDLELVNEGELAQLTRIAELFEMT